jgi:hypothetical protein
LCSSWDRRHEKQGKEKQEKKQRAFHGQI